MCMIIVHVHDYCACMHASACLCLSMCVCLCMCLHVANQPVGPKLFHVLKVKTLVHAKASTKWWERITQIEMCMWHLLTEYLTQFATTWFCPWLEKIIVCPKFIKCCKLCSWSSGYCIVCLWILCDWLSIACAIMVNCVLQICTYKITLHCITDMHGWTAWYAVSCFVKITISIRI